MRTIERFLAAGAIALSGSLAACGYVWYGYPEYSRMLRDEKNQATRAERDAQLRANPPDALPISFSIYSGKVGHHVHSRAGAWCSLDNTPWSSSTPTVVGGTLPPGLSLRTDGNTRIEGTPEQPGRWTATIRFTNIGCRGKTYPDQDVTFEFSVEGDAVKGL